MHIPSTFFSSKADFGYKSAKNFAPKIIKDFLNNIYMVINCIYIKNYKNSAYFKEKRNLI